MKLIFGLGNPGKSYTYTLHNLGFLALDCYLERHGLKTDKTKHSSLYVKSSIEGETRIFVKPQTFMNRSGVAVAPFFRSLKIEPKEMIVVHDDIDIEEGLVRIKLGGGDGGHKGIRSIIEHLGGEKDFLRIRIGVGRPPDDMDPADYVLRKITKKSLMTFVKPSVEALDTLLREGYNRACNIVNRDL